MDMTINRWVAGLVDHKVQLLIIDYETDPNRSLKGALAKAQAHIRRLDKEREQMEKIILAKKIEVVNEILQNTDAGCRLPNNKAHLLAELRALNDKEANPYDKYKLKESSRPRNDSSTRGRKRFTDDV